MANEQPERQPDDNVDRIEIKLPFASMSLRGKNASRLYNAIGIVFYILAVGWVIKNIGAIYVANVD